MKTLHGHQLFRSNEIRFSFTFMACLSVLHLFVIPNDFILIGNPAILFLAVSLRILFSILCTSFFVIAFRNPEGMNFDRVMAIMVACSVCIDVFLTWTRPAGYLFSFVPSFLLISAFYFIIPADSIVKIISAIALSAAELFFAIFVKDTPVAAKIIILLTYVGFNIIGIACSLYMERLRTDDMLYRIRMEDQVRFKKALADTLFDAVLLLQKRHVVDCNNRFLEIAEDVGFSADDVMLADLDTLFRFDSPVFMDAFSKGESADAILSGKSRQLPVSVRQHDVKIDGNIYTGILVRDRSDELAESLRQELLKSPENQQISSERIGELQLSKREKEIVSGIISGLSVFSIADELFLSEMTVRKHIEIIYRKLGIKSNMELIRMILVP